MATTTKTLTPTNQTITLPDMTERPNASVLVDGIGKDADAINALDTKMGKQIRQIAYTNDASVQFNVSSNSRYIFIATAADCATWAVICFVSADNSGNVIMLEIKKGSGNITFTTNVANKFTVTYPGTVNRHYYCIPLNDAGDMTLVT